MVPSNEGRESTKADCLLFTGSYTMRGNIVRVN